MPDFDWPKRETNRLKCASCGEKDRKSDFIETKDIPWNGPTRNNLKTLTIFGVTVSLYSVIKVHTEISSWCSVE